MITEKHFLSGPNGRQTGLVTTPDGRVIRCLGFTCLRTYDFADLFSGMHPDDDYNQKALGAIESFAKSLPPRLNEVKIETPNSISYIVQYGSLTVEKTRLPHFFLLLDLESTAVDPSNDMFSSIRYVKFIDHVDLLNVGAMVEEIIKALDWNRVAQDWTP